MLEKFTVDMLAAHVASLQEGKSTPRMARALYRKGRRDGKRSYDYNSMGGLLLDAVGLASSALCEAFLLERRPVEVRMAELRAVDDPRNEDDGYLADNRDVLAADKARVPKDDQVSSAGLAAALQARQRLHTEQAHAARRRDGQLARQELAKQDAVMLCMATEYRQRFDTITCAGQLLWSRYCNGYELGHARRGSRDSNVNPPVAALEFPVPLALRDSADGLSNETAGRASDTSRPLPLTTVGQARQDHV
jgi:hypothetical protein